MRSHLLLTLIAAAFIFGCAKKEESVEMTEETVQEAPAADQSANAAGTPAEASTEAPAAAQ